MHFSALLAVFPGVALADFYLNEWTCNASPGVDFIQYGYSTSGQGACGGTAVSFDGTTYTGNNPCGGSDSLVVIGNDLTVQGTGVIGSCGPVATTALQGDCGDCQAGSIQYCSTSYC